MESLYQMRFQFFGPGASREYVDRLVELKLLL